MKILPIIMATFMAIGIQAQTLLDAPTNKSKVIVVLLDSVAPPDAYRLAASTLLDAGYQLSKTDETLHLLTTDWQKGPGFFVYELSFSVNVRPYGHGSQIRLSGQVRTENPTPDTKALLGGDYNVDDIEKRSSAGKYWKQLEALATQLGGRVMYL